MTGIYELRVISFILIRKTILSTAFLPRKFPKLLMNTRKPNPRFAFISFSIEACIALAIFLLIIELVYHFVGYSMFLEKCSIISFFGIKLDSLIHAIGIVVISFFAVHSWHYVTLWYMWVPFKFFCFNYSLLPFILETLAFIYGYVMD